MDESITKKLHISGLTPAIAPEVLFKRLETFGRVKETEGFGLRDGLGNQRKFGYITLETTTGQLARCLNLLSGTTWKGAKLRIGEAKPDFAERLALERQAESDEPPKKRRKRFGAVHAEDMSLVTSENVSARPGWKVTPLGRMMRPVKLRPERPLPIIQEAKVRVKQAKVLGGKNVDPEKKKKKKRITDPDSRARRRTIDMTKWGSTHLKGIFLENEAHLVGEMKGGNVDIIEDVGDKASSEDEQEDSHSEDQNLEPMESPPIPRSELVENNLVTIPPPFASPPIAIVDANLQGLHDDNADVALEKAKSLNLLASLFQDGTEWVGQESVDSDIDEEALTKGDKIIADDDDIGFEIVPIETAERTTNMRQEGRGGEATIPDISQLNRTQTRVPKSKKTTLKDLFAPREEEAGFSLLGHLDIDSELEGDIPFLSIEAESEALITEIPATLDVSSIPFTTAHSQSPLTLNPKQALFFPLDSSSQNNNKARPKDLFDIAKDNHWNWRDPSVGFYRTRTDDEIRKKWEEDRVELTRGWKKRSREAMKTSRRRGLRGVDMDAE